MDEHQSGVKLEEALEAKKELDAKAQKILEAAKQKPTSQPQASNITPPDPSSQQPHPGRGPRLN